MKTVFSTMATVGLASILPWAAQAGQGEWATAGKVLTGVVAAGVIAEALRPHPAPAPVVVYQTPAPTVVYSTPGGYLPPPGSTVVYTYPPAPQVVYAPAPPVVVGLAPAFYYGPHYGPRPYYAYPYARHYGVQVHFGGRW